MAKAKPSAVKSKPAPLQPRKQVPEPAINARVVYSGSSEADLADVIQEKEINTALLIVPHRDTEIVVDGKTITANSRTVIAFRDPASLKINSGSVTAIALPLPDGYEITSPIGTSVPDVGEHDLADGITGSELSQELGASMLHITAEKTIPTAMLQGALVGTLSGVLYCADSVNSPAIHYPAGVFLRTDPAKTYFTKADDCSLILLKPE